MPAVGVEKQQDMGSRSSSSRRKAPSPLGTGATLTVVGQSTPPRGSGEGHRAGPLRLRRPSPRSALRPVLRSPIPHARIRRIDISRAEQAPGVHAVISLDERRRSPGTRKPCSSKRRFVSSGEEVAAVAAESEEIAEDALRLIEVEYEPLPFVTSIEAALRPDAPRVHEGGNMAGEPKIYAAWRR